MTIKICNDLFINGTNLSYKSFMYSNELHVGGGSSGPSWQDIIMSGNTALTLTNAKANGLNYLKLFGKCEQDGTPTPDEPLQIVCNNGTIKYSANMANVNEQTALVGCYISAQGVVTADANNWIYQDYIPVKPNTTYTLSMSSSVYYVTISEYSTADDSGFVIRKAGSSGDNTTRTITTESTTNYIRFGTNLDRSAVTLDRVLAINWMLNQGNSMPYAPYSPNGAYADGTVETVEVTGKNLFDQATATRYSTSWSGAGNGYWQVVSSSSEAVCYGSYVEPNTTYTLSKKGGSRLIITGYTTKTEPSSSQTTPADYKIKTDTTETIDGSYTFTTPANCTWILFGLRQNNATFTFPYDVQLELGSTATTYENYFNGGQATAEMLLRVGDYQDVQSVLDGNVTRNIGIKVLDGTEDWESTSTTGLWLLRNVTGTVLPSTCICNHFLGVSTTTGSNMPDLSMRYGVTGYDDRLYIRYNSLTNANELKQFLADQYANGTPVIVVYPLKIATTESVAHQHLGIQAGTNIVEITQASIDNLGLEVSYKGTV